MTSRSVRKNKRRKLTPERRTSAHNGYGNGLLTDINGLSGPRGSITRDARRDAKVRIERDRWLAATWYMRLVIDQIKTEDIDLTALEDAIESNNVPLARTIFEQLAGGFREHSRLDAPNWQPTLKRYDHRKGIQNTEEFWKCIDLAVIYSCWHDREFLPMRLPIMRVRRGSWPDPEPEILVSPTDGELTCNQRINGEPCRQRLVGARLCRRAHDCPMICTFCSSPIAIAAEYGLTDVQKSRLTTKTNEHTLTCALWFLSHGLHDTNKDSNAT